MLVVIDNEEGKWLNDWQFGRGLFSLKRDNGKSNEKKELGGKSP